eukprot:766631-Hanusia_phi.AAC.2
MPEISARPVASTHNLDAAALAGSEPVSLQTSASKSTMLANVLYSLLQHRSQVCPRPGRPALVEADCLRGRRAGKGAVGRHQEGIGCDGRDAEYESSSSSSSSSISTWPGTISSGSRTRWRMRALLVSGSYVPDS